MDDHLSDLLHLLKNGQKFDSFAAHFEQHFNSTTSNTDLRKYMTFKVVKQLNPIDTMKTFTKPNCNLCMEERLTILKNLRDKRFTIMNNNSEIYGAYRHKTNFHRFFLSTGCSFARPICSSGRLITNDSTMFLFLRKVRSNIYPVVSKSILR